ncbi:MAG: hypothetical protein CM1200mP21_08410 [Candidatus Poseidoniales archaeon]|nr:MAG: hypothetical protein CM1200mP21_08410 [Candidatus Poseidoniales archaeon]
MVLGDDSQDEVIQAVDNAAAVNEGRVTLLRLTTWR